MDADPIQVSKVLGGIDYPADIGNLANHARSNGADDDMLQALPSLQTERFNSPEYVSEAIGRN
jgi:hypothetical protein